MWEYSGALRFMQNCFCNGATSPPLLERVGAVLIDGRVAAAPTTAPVAACCVARTVVRLVVRERLLGNLPAFCVSPRFFPFATQRQIKKVHTPCLQHIFATYRAVECSYGTTSPKSFGCAEPIQYGAALNETAKELLQILSKL